MKRTLLVALVSLLAIGSASADYWDDVRNYTTPGYDRGASDTMQRGDSDDMSTMPPTSAGQNESENDEHPALWIPEHG